jgi:DNA sulfur modification protein DndD
MIIKAIRLEDFRQFKGKQNIDISTDEHKNVTLIHAENSVGKTTILNAILWCFFERTTGRFEQKAEIVNFEARSEGKKTAYVEIIFLSDDQEYEARRVYDSGTKKSELRVRKVDPSGAIGGAINYPDILIREVLPEQMAPYFFFDGEQAENYASESGGSVIAGAIRDIMGSKLIEQAISDLDETRKYFNRQVGNQSHDSQIEQLQREYEVIEKKCDEISVRLPNYKTSIESIERQIDDIEKGLRGIEKLKTLQEARYQTEKSIRDVEVEISKLKRKIVEWIPDYGRALLARGLVEKCVEVVAKNSAKGVIPAPYNQKFVEGVLAKMICICGHDIKDNSDEYRAIYSLMDKASSPVIESIIVRLQGRNLRT